MMVSKKNTILVFGGAGFIGSNFIRHILKKQNNKVVNFDKLTYAGNPDNLKDIAKDRRYTFVKGDIANKKAVDAAFKKYKPNYVVNFAAETHVDRSIHGEASDFLHANVTGVLNILEAVRDSKGVKKFIHMSTDEVYGDLPLKSKSKFKEADALRPSNPYSATKASAEMLCMAYHRTFGVPVVVFRCGNNYGPYQFPEKFIPFFILKLVKGEMVPLYGSGKNIRDWVHVYDTARALELGISRGVAGEVYNISSDDLLSNIDVTKKLIRFFGETEKAIKKVSDRPGHDRKYALDSRKIKRELGWYAKQDFEKGLESTIKWYINNGSWIDKVERRTERINAHIK